MSAAPSGKQKKDAECILSDHAVGIIGYGVKTKHQAESLGPTFQFDSTEEPGPKPFSEPKTVRWREATFRMTTRICRLTG